ncbi:MAG: hypothetical protein KDC46_16235 [Thermoleophilia bacterium]|nr:hypothetical protein [Thermoleophilia bacterium]
MGIETSALRAVRSIATTSTHAPAIEALAKEIDDIAKLAGSRPTWARLGEQARDPKLTTDLFTRLANAVAIADQEVVRLADGHALDTGLSSILRRSRDDARAAFQHVSVARETGGAIERYASDTFADLLYDLRAGGPRHEQLVEGIARHAALDDAVRGAGAAGHDGAAMTTREAAEIVKRAVTEPAGSVPGLGAALEALHTVDHPGAKKAMEYVRLDIGGGAAAGWRTLGGVDTLIRDTALADARAGAASRADEIIASATAAAAHG